ncbi:protein of unknown function [Clostridium beijerinckii]|nr:protein of unknown function [Clostridium beijerinckii]
MDIHKLNVLEIRGMYYLAKLDFVKKYENILFLYYEARV